MSEINSVARQLVPVAFSHGGSKCIVSIEDTSRRLFAHELDFLSNRLRTIYIEVPDLLEFLKALVGWERGRRTGHTRSLPSIQEVVAAGDVIR
jgi:hypothetical protein